MQLINITAGTLGNSISAANGIWFNIKIVWYSMANGIGGATSKLIGNSIGEKKI